MVHKQQSVGTSQGPSVVGILAVLAIVLLAANRYIAN